MRNRASLKLLLVGPIVLLTCGATWLWWQYEHRPGAVLARNFEKIRPGMSLGQVNALLGQPGVEITADQVAREVDGTQPVESPKRVKPVVSGERFFSWGASDETWIEVSFTRGEVSGKRFSQQSF